MSELVASRRIVFSGLGALGVAAALAGCGGGSDSPSGGGGTTTGGAASSEAAGEVLATTAEVPVGGGVVLTDKHVVITQPTEGEFKAFSSRCLHQGFDVGKVEDGTITCMVHNSTYDAATGEVTGGPAPSGQSLEERAITVKGDQIVAA